MYIICAILQDPVKYPDTMSPNFKSFLKGLLNKVLSVFCQTFPLGVDKGVCPVKCTCLIDYFIDL